MKNFLADIMMKSENPDLFEYILYKKLHGTKSTVKKEEGAPPLTFTSSGFPLNSYEIFGNLVNGEGVGDRTENLFDFQTVTTGYRIQWSTGNMYADSTAKMSDYIPISTGFYSFDAAYFVIGFDDNKTYLGAYNNGSFVKDFSAGVSAVNIPSGCSYIKILSYSSQPEYQGFLSETTMINSGSTALPYEPYGYKIPVSCGGETTTIYIGENPLRKALDDSVFDELSSEGIIIRRVDDEGTPLVEPITETVTCPVIDTDEGSNTFDVDTTVTPSKVILYHT